MALLLTSPLARLAHRGGHAGSNLHAGSAGVCVESCHHLAAAALTIGAVPNLVALRRPLPEFDIGLALEPQAAPVADRIKKRERQAQTRCSSQAPLRPSAPPVLDR